MAACCQFGSAIRCHIRDIICQQPRGDERGIRLMDYTIHYEADEGYFAVTLFSDAYTADIYTLATEALRLAQECHCFKSLNDVREARMRLSLADLYEEPDRLAKLVAPSGLAIHQFKRAVVIGSDAVDEYSFFETVARNRSHNVRVFHDYDEAKAWLLES